MKDLLLFAEAILKTLFYTGMGLFLMLVAIGRAIWR